VVARPDRTAPLDNAQLSRELAEAVEQQAATSEVLDVIGRSTFELDPVFETVVRHAVRLCRADAGMIYQLDGDVYRLACLVGGSSAYRAYLADKPIVATHGTLVGRVGLERRVVQIDDVIADPDYEFHEARRLGGQRTMLGVPMLSAGRVVGVIMLWRFEVDRFDDRAIGLVSTFAAQGAVAIQNVRLFGRLQGREAELARSVDELRALGEIGQAVSSSLDSQHVLTTIVTRAVELSEAEGGSIFEFDIATGLFHLRTCSGTSAELIDALRATRIHIDETFVGRAAKAGEPWQAASLSEETPDAHIDRLLDAGWRSMLVVPLLRHPDILGALVVRRKVPGAFDERTADLLETLASQSAVAIYNARMFRELEEKTRQLEVASQHKSDFLASMSHELRTPLNAVIGFSDVLLERMFGELNERQDEYLRDIRNSGRHLLELINEILDLSKVEAGRMELDLHPVSISDLLGDALAMVRERAERHHLALHLHVDPDLPAVLGDELKLKQVVLNLVTNAVKFTADEGTISVAARVVGGEAHVTVRDNGVGIPEQDQERIFEAFQRGGLGPRSTSEGTGLGLTLSKRIVELHGGRVWLTSRVGAGSTFGFAIPAAPLEAAGRGVEDPAPHQASAAGEPTVLVIEDDRPSASLLRLHLEGAGYTVAIAHDGEEGVRLARRLQPRAVLLDVLLPRLDGWGVLARLKADSATARLPVIIVSMVDEPGKAFALGAAEYLLKPVGREQVVDALARCLRNAGDRRIVVAIDDDPVDLDLIEALLEPEGYTILRASGGEEGLAIVQRELPAVVLLDLMMPGLDGFAFVERLRTDPTTTHVPVIVLTAKDLTAADRRRLADQISHLAQKGAYGRAGLVELVGRLALPTPREASV
jgi:signal transduction histidine kinase/CheY-like chemotaxis protein